MPLVLGCAIPLMACGVAGSGPDVAELEAFRLSRERWDLQELTSYRYTLELHAMIIDGRPIAIEVRNGAPVSVQFVDGGPPVETTPEGSFVARFDTVEDLFRIIEEQLETDADRIATTYDPSLGYPISAEIDPEENAIDDEFGFRVRGFEGFP
jgi:hypothetical protein